MFAFIDETGNSGTNVFDAAQPYFMTGALMTRSDFDSSFGAPVLNAAKRLGLSTLHAKELRLEGVDAVASDVHKALKKANARLLISCVEKDYLLAAKVTDTLLDPWENKAVPRHVYNLRALRMLLLFKLNALLEEQHKRLFWETILCKKEADAQAKFSLFCDKLVPRCELLPDARSRELLSRALIWGRDNPSSFYLHPGSRFMRDGRSPNVIGFLNVLEGLELQSEVWNRPVRRIKHDRTIEFEGSLSKWHELLSNASPEPALTAWGEPPRKIRMVPNSDFVVSSSADSPGIQVIDIVLWLTKRLITGDRVTDGSAGLVRFIAKRAIIKDFTFKGMEHRLTSMIDTINSRPLTPAALAAGAKMLDEFESECESNGSPNL